MNICIIKISSYDCFQILLYIINFSSMLFINVVNLINQQQFLINYDLNYQQQNLQLIQLSMQPATQLYIREFFNNYFLNKQHQETMTGFAGAVEVLDHLISAFYNNNSAIFISSTVDSESLISPLPLKQQYKSNMNILFQCLYKKIQTLLAVWTQRQQTSHIIDGFDQNRMEKTEEFINRAEGQQQLYELLNEYKNDNKKLKQRLKQIEKKSTEKDQKILELENKIKQMKISISKTDDNVIELQELRDSLYQYEREQKIQEIQKQQFVKHISQQQDRILSIKHEFEHLLAKYEHIQKQNGILKQLQAKMPQLINKKITQLIPNIQNMITMKLRNQIQIENATIKTVRKVLGSLSVK